MTLANLLNSKKCFKLVCGAGNDDPEAVEKLVAVYALAGARFFDLSANVDIVKSAKKGLKRVIPQKEIKNYFLCVSVGIKGDPHVQKALIDVKKCVSCGACKIACQIQKAIKNEGKKYFVLENKCIGCEACLKRCKFNAITMYHKKKNLNKIIPEIIKLGIDCLELHAITGDEDRAFNDWNLLQKYFSGVLSLCLDRVHLGDAQLINRIKRFIAGRKGYNTIIQADGAPMSGSSNSYNTTLQALGTADIVQKAKLPVWILMSGGTNSKTTKMAKIFEISAHGVSIGSYARKIIASYLDAENFFANKKAFNKACHIAQKLVDTSLKYLG